MNNLWYSMSKLEFSKIKKHRHYLWCISIKFYEWIQCNSIFLKFGSILTFLHLFYCNMCIIFHKILFKNLLFPSSYNPLLIDIPAHFNDYFVPPITHFWNFCPPWKCVNLTMPWYGLLFTKFLSIWCQLFPNCLLSLRVSVLVFFLTR